MGNVIVWGFLIVPNVYFKGFANSLITLKTSHYCFITCFGLFCSISILLIGSAYKLALWYIGSLVPSEKGLVFSNFGKDNLPLQLFIIIFGDPSRNSVEVLI